MNDTESARTGYTKLYHPRGPLVSLPVTGDNPAAMFACVSAMLDAGFVVAAPGLEVGEEREMVSGVLRGSFEREGEITPIVLLYAANEAMKYSFLKLYLNSDEDVKSLETACHLKLDSLPEYDGKDKPERDGGKVAIKYIVKLPKPVPVVFKQNPKWSEEENAKAIAAQKPYTVPKRIFVRWADAPPPAASAPPGDGTPPLTDMQVAESAWKVRLQSVLAVDDLNKQIPLIKAVTDQPIRARVWTMCRDLANSKNWMLDAGAGVFRHAAEMTAPPPPPVVAAPPTPPPPPPDEPTVSLLVAAWQKRLETVNLSKLNGEILTNFKSIGRTEPSRNDVWVMIDDAAKKINCKFDTSVMKFAESVGDAT